MTVEEQFREYIKVSFKTQLSAAQLEVLRNAYFFGTITGAINALENSEALHAELSAFKEQLVKRCKR